MPYSFYNDKINDELYSITNSFISEKDLQLTNLIYRTYKKKVIDEKPIRFNEFEKSFNNIYSFSTNQKGQMYEAYRNQRDINQEQAQEKFKENGEEKVNDYKVDNSLIFDETNKELQEFLNSLLLSSWSKVNNMINEYNKRVSQLPQIGEEI